jgi:hypothetical protein
LGLGCWHRRPRHYRRERGKKGGDRVLVMLGRSSSYPFTRSADGPRESEWEPQRFCVTSVESLFLPCLLSSPSWLLPPPPLLLLLLLNLSQLLLSLRGDNSQRVLSAALGGMVLRKESRYIAPSAAAAPARPKKNGDGRQRGKRRTEEACDTPYAVPERTVVRGRLTVPP